MASKGLRDVLGLPPARETESPGYDEELGRAFRDVMGNVNGNLRVVAAQAAAADHELLDAQRARLYEAFQIAISQTDAARSQQAAQRVLAAAGVVETRASTAATSAASGRQVWSQRESEFDAAMLQIGELEEARHAKARVLRQLDDVPTTAEFDARTLVAASYFDPAADTVVNVTNVATLTGHTVQTGDTYALANGATGFVAIDTVVDGIQTDLSNGTDGLGALKTLIDGVPTTAELDARTLVAASYFNPATDAVANVTLVATTTTNTDMVAAAPTAAAISDVVWDEDLSTGHAVANSGAVRLSDVLVDTADIQPNYATAAALATVDGIVDAILVDTGTTIPATLAALNDVAATDIVSAGAITTLAGAVVNVDLVDTCTTNTDMVGTDGANTVIPDAAGTAAGLHATTDGLITTVDTVIDAVKVKTDQFVFTVANQVDANSLTSIIGTGSGLTAIPWSSSWDIDVESEVTDALNAYDPPTKAELDTAVATLATPTNITAGTITSVADLTVTANAEPTGVPAANETLAAKIGYLYAALRNKVSVTATEKTFYDDGGTAEWKKTLSDDATTYAEEEGAAP